MNEESAEKNPQVTAFAQQPGGSPVILVLDMK